MLELNMEAFNMSHPSHLGRAYESRVKDLLISCQAADNEFNVNGINIDNVLVTGLSTNSCLLYTSPSPRDKRQSRMPSSA